jgi:hypothetical protein
MWEGLTLECQPVTGHGRPVRSRPPRGPPLGRGHPGPNSAGPGDRLIGQDPRIIPRFAKGQTLGLLIERESSDAAAKGIKQCRRASRLAEELVALASRQSPVSAAGGGHASRWRRRSSKGQQGATQLRSQSIACDSETSRDRQHWPRLNLGPGRSVMGRDRYVRNFPLALVTQKRLALVNQEPGELWHFVSSCFWFPISSFARATSFFHLHLICLHPFVLVPSLPLLFAFPFKKICTSACRSELLLLTTLLMGINAAALSTDSAGPGL